MSDRLRVPASGARTAWLFAIDLPADALDAFRTERFEDEDTVHWPLRDALGLEHMDHDFIEVFEAETLKDYGFANYLTEANGLSEESVSPDAGKLDALAGPVLLVFSAALPSGTAQLAPRAPLRFIGRYSEEGTVTLRAAPETKSAQRTHPPAPDSTAKPTPASGKIIAAVVLLMLLAALLLGFG